MTDYRASFDASITFGNGGDLVVHGFRVDLPGPKASDAEIATLFVASLGLLMTDEVELTNVEIFAEPHKGTRGGPSDHRIAVSGRGRVVDLTGVGTRLAGEAELADLVDLPAIVVRWTQGPVGVGALAAFDVHGAAVLLMTWSMTEEAGRWLADSGAALVATSATTFDPVAAGALMAEGVPLVEGLDGLDELPPTGARLFAVPLAVPGRPVRAFAMLPD